jgi:hypothetical protein
MKFILFIFCLVSVLSNLYDGLIAVIILMTIYLLIDLISYLSDRNQERLHNIEYEMDDD